MVVVDNARKVIGKTIDVSVTSVLQTTAGKMIFGKWDERSSPRAEPRNAMSAANSIADSKKHIVVGEQSPE
jgi:hypothetical protein